ncbi:MAG: CoA pyrophosphatase [Bacteroidota bacterium]
MCLNDLISKFQITDLANLLKGEISHAKMFPSIRSEQLKNRDLTAPPLSSAVLILLYEKSGEICFCLIKRAEDGFAHSGQVSFPGGKVEKKDVDIIHTALREANEEVGVNLSLIKVIGQLTDLYIPPSNFIVTPILAYCNEVPNFTINKDEVQYIIECSLNTLLNEEKLKITQMKYKDIEFVVPYFDVETEVVWGATAMILSELKDLIVEIKKASI